MFTGGIPSSAMIDRKTLGYKSLIILDMFASSQTKYYLHDHSRFVRIGQSKNIDRMYGTRTKSSRNSSTRSTSCQPKPDSSTSPACTTTPPRSGCGASASPRLGNLRLQVPQAAVFGLQLADAGLGLVGAGFGAQGAERSPSYRTGGEKGSSAG